MNETDQNKFRASVRAFCFTHRRYPDNWLSPTAGHKNSDNHLARQFSAEFLQNPDNRAWAHLDAELVAEYRETQLRMKRGNAKYLQNKKIANNKHAHQSKRPSPIISQSSKTDTVPDTDMTPISDRSSPLSTACPSHPDVTENHDSPSTQEEDDTVVVRRQPDWSEDETTQSSNVDGDTGVNKSVQEAGDTPSAIILNQDHAQETDTRPSTSEADQSLWNLSYNSLSSIFRLCSNAIEETREMDGDWSFEGQAVYVCCHEAGEPRADEYNNRSTWFAVLVDGFDRYQQWLDGRETAGYDLHSDGQYCRKLCVDTSNNPAVARA